MRLLLSLLLLYEILFFATDYLLVSDDLIYNSFADQISYERLMEIISDDKENKWLSYFIIPIFLLLRFFMVGLSLTTGGIIIGVENAFTRFFRLVIIAEFVFILPMLIKIFWFSFIQTDYSLIELQHFSPLSIFSLFNHTEVEPWLAYPLQILNLFELAFWCTLAWQLKKILDRDFAGSLGFVASTYGVGLLLWVILVMFLTVSLT